MVTPFSLVDVSAFALTRVHLYSSVLHPKRAGPWDLPVHSAENEIISRERHREEDHQTFPQLQAQPSHLQRNDQHILDLKVPAAGP